MHHRIIEQFNGKNVEVSTNSGFKFSGNLKLDSQHFCVILTSSINVGLPFYGPAFIDSGSIISIQEKLG